MVTKGVHYILGIRYMERLMSGLYYYRLCEEGWGVSVGRVRVNIKNAVLNDSYCARMAGVT